MGSKEGPLSADCSGRSPVAAFVDSLAATIAVKVESQRLVVAIAGPPGGGKTTASKLLRDALVARHQLLTQVVPMDGFHYDNAVLEQRGLLARKGAPETFDVGGLESVLMRLTAADPADVAVPVFDRRIELARAGARIIRADTKVVLVEGNYLLLLSEPWCRLGNYFGVKVMIECDEPVLRARLMRRWLELGLHDAAAVFKVETNDLPNARKVSQDSGRADYTVSETASLVS